MATAEPMTFEDLSSVNRLEQGSPSLIPVRKDLYAAMADLLNRQIKECEKLAATNPDSIMYDGAHEKKKKIAKLIQRVIELRTTKIASMAVLGGLGSQIVIDALTPEEKDYCNRLLEITREHVRASKCEKKPAVIPDITKPTEPAPVRKEEKVEKKAEPSLDEIPDEALFDEQPQTEAVTPEEEEFAPPVDIPVDDFPPEEEPEQTEEFFPEEKPIEAVTETEPAPAVEQPPIKPVELPEDGFAVIRILEDIPPFSGPDRNYSLVKEDVVRMPAMMAAALINRGVAKLITL